MEPVLPYATVPTPADVTTPLSLRRLASLGCKLIGVAYLMLKSIGIGRHTNP